MTCYKVNTSLVSFLHKTELTQKHVLIKISPFELSQLEFPFMQGLCRLVNGL